MIQPEQLSDSITLYEGDCLDVLLTLAGAGVNCVMTSPPYNQMSAMPEKATGSWGDSHGGAGFVRAWRESGYEDDVDELEYQRQQNEIFALCADAANDTASLFFNHQCRWRDGVILHPVIWFQPQGWILREEIIWDRGGGMMSNAKMFCRYDERILWFDKGRHKWNQESTGHGTIWRIARMQQQQGKLHPVQFPLEIPRRCILATTDHGEIVLDPFAGSGTTGIAAAMEGRKAILIEKDPAYCEVIRKRVREFECQQPQSLFREELRLM